MARSIKTGPVGDAQPHEAGSGIVVIQMLVHEPIGAPAYGFAPRWPHHARLAHETAERLQAAHAQLVEIPELSGDFRRVAGQTAAAAYEAGTAMVSNVAPTIRHLAASIVSEAGGRVSWGRVLDELRNATGAVNIDARINSAGHHALAGITTIRDAIEHPQPASQRHRLGQGPLGVDPLHPQRGRLSRLRAVAQRTNRRLGRMARCPTADADDYDRCARHGITVSSEEGAQALRVVSGAGPGSSRPRGGGDGRAG